MRIVQMSDVHVGSGLFRPDLLEATIEESNALEPDLVAIVGDLTMEGYRWEFEEAKQYFDRLECPNIIYAMGNHDAKNVGYRHFEEFFGIREKSAQIPVPEGEAKVVALDSTKPDLDEGEVGREHYGWLDSEFRGWEGGPRILMIHHHILAVPGTGRDVNNLRDAGDVMAILRELKVDMVLSGHRHVPYVWSISGVRIVHSGTVSTMRVRGTMPPSYNVVEIDEESVNITLQQPCQGEEGREPLASFSRTPVTTSEFYPAFERFVVYDRLPFLSASPTTPPWEGEPADPDAGGGPKR
ncbi:MAG TPA: metallophosphoesterase [Rubrobacter sp.]|nr:metallophosphoesterase [Rubrobacter sp.]